LIVASVLFYMGTGPVKGFAVTLAVGIVTTVFTAYTLTAWLFGVWVRRSRPKHLPNGIRTAIFDGKDFPFMRYRRYVFIFTGVVMLGCIGGFVTKGLNLGIDFQGGSVIEVKAKQGDADIADIREKLSQLNLGEIQAQGFGSTQDVLIRIQAQDGGENAEQSAITLVRGELEDKYDFRRVEVVGPAVSGDLTFTSTIGILLAMVAIMGYIWIRFEWQFALGAIISMVHDVVFTIGLFVFLGIEFNLTSIAAILTIIGYSLNDTVVIYDRIRENLRRYKKMPLSMIIDVSLNQTLSRTILTGLTVMLALLSLYLFGGEVIRSFTFAMLFGVGIGVFSSVYIAAPVLIAFKLRPGGNDAADDKADAKRDAIGGKPAV
jgi:SecD/SecF fusion protein